QQGGARQGLRRRSERSGGLVSHARGMGGGGGRRRLAAIEARSSLGERRDRRLAGLHEHAAGPGGDRDILRRSRAVGRKRMTSHILVVDQGTTSTRSIVFGPDAAPVASAQQEFKQIYPRPGWIEHDPNDLWTTTLATLRGTVEQMKA